MRGTIGFGIGLSALLVGVLAFPTSLAAQGTTQPRPPASRPAPAPRVPVGVDVFGGAGFTFPASQDSYDAVDLSSTPVDYGGGVRVNGLWSKLFVQGTVSRWSDTGERAFVASDGSSFPLGIPLDVNATFIDGTIGLREVMRAANGRISIIRYVGAGAGIVRYEESSPFAEAGDDLDTTKPSYHVLAGLEIPLNRWLAFNVDGRFRYVPGILGDDGVSAQLGDDALGGFQISLGLRIGFGYAPLKVAEAIDRIRLPFNVSVPGLEAATAALSDEAHQTASRDLISNWKPRLTQALRGFGLNVLPSAGNFVLVLFDGAERAAAANDYLNSKGIIVRPVGGYGLPQALRITIGTEDQNRAVIDALSEFAAT